MTDSTFRPFMAFIRPSKAKRYSTLQKSALKSVQCKHLIWSAVQFLYNSLFDITHLVVQLHLDANCLLTALPIWSSTSLIVYSSRGWSISVKASGKWENEVYMYALTESWKDLLVFRQSQTTLNYVSKCVGFILKFSFHSSWLNLGTTLSH